MANYVQTWIRRRFQFDQHKQLQQRDILIFIYGQGFLYVVLILITFVAGINYANNLILGFCFLISAVLLISFYLTFKQLHGMHIEFIAPPVGQVNQALTLCFELSQKNPHLRLLKFKFADEEYQYAMSTAQKSIEFHLIPKQRGLYVLPRLMMYSTYPLGLVRAWSYVYLKHEFWIAPEAKILSHELRTAQQLGDPDFNEFRELRDCREGDSLQRISWKQAARGQGLFVKVFEDEMSQQKMRIDYQQMPSADHEEKLQFMMGLVQHCEQQQCEYQLLLPQVELPFGVGDEHYEHARKLLAQA